MLRLVNKERDKGQMKADLVHVCSLCQPWRLSGDMFGQLLFSLLSAKEFSV